MKRLNNLVIVALLLTAYSCKNRQLLDGQLKNLTGLDGCSWIIELDTPDKSGNKKLEPVNLNNFQITLREGQPVKLKYKEAPVLSTCMAGKPVEIEVIKTK